MVFQFPLINPLNIANHWKYNHTLKRPSSSLHVSANNWPFAWSSHMVQNHVQLVPVHLDLPSFWKSHCATCVPCYRIMQRAYYNFPTTSHWMGSCDKNVIYQTLETVFHRDIETTRRELKRRRAAEYFWRNSRCFDSRWSLSQVFWYIFSIELNMTKTKEQTEK